MTTKISITLEDEVLEDLEIFVNSLNRRNRSYVINLAVKEFLNKGSEGVVNQKLKMQNLIKKINGQSSKSE